MVFTIYKKKLIWPTDLRIYFAMVNGEFVTVAGIRHC